MDFHMICGNTAYQKHLHGLQHQHKPNMVSNFSTDHAHQCGPLLYHEPDPFIALGRSTGQGLQQATGL